MNKREHFRLWLKTVKPELPMSRDADADFYYHPIVDTAYRAWLASPKTRPTEPNKISKEQLAAMKADTTEIVDHLRGIYTGIADAYPVNPLMLKAADEIERLREEVNDAARNEAILSNQMRWMQKQLLSTPVNKHQTTTKEQ